MAKAKVLFVYPNERGMSVIPPAIAILSKLLKDDGHQTDLFDTTFYDFEDDISLKNADKNLENTLQVRPVEETNSKKIQKKKTNPSLDLREKINNFKPDILAISCTETTFPRALKLIQATRDLGVFNIFGGVFPTFAPEATIKFNEIDCVCVGEGEKALVDLANNFVNNKCINKITNLWVKQKNGKITKNPITKPVDINELPVLTDIGLFDQQRFYRPLGGKIRKVLPVETHRGCPYTCAFCNSPSQNVLYSNSGGHFFRKKSMKLIKDEIESHIKNWGTEYVFFWADTFLAWSPQEFDEFCEMYQDVKLPFWCQTRIETISEYKLKKLKEVGLDRITFGMEHGNEKFRREVVKRNYSNKKAVELMRIPSDLDIIFTVNNIIGFPGETRELAFDTINLNREFKSDNATCSILIPFAGTEIRKLAEKQGLIDADKICSVANSSDEGVLDMPQWNKKEVAKLSKVFSMYVKFPKDRWPEIEKAEEDTELFNKLKDEFLNTFWSKKGDKAITEAAKGLF